MTADVWVHDLNPFLLRFSPTLGVRWYGLAYLTGFIAGGIAIWFIARRGRGAVIRPAQVTDYVTYVVLGTMLGGRLGYALFYAPELFIHFSPQFPYWNLLKVWEGGMASHGGILGIIIAAGFFAKRQKLIWLHLCDLVTFGGSIGIFFGRIANFINGELFGRPAPPGFRFAVKFPGEMFLWLRHDAETMPTALDPQLLPKMNDAVRQLGLNFSEWQAWLVQVHGSVPAQNRIQFTISQVISAIDNGNTLVRDQLAPFLTPRYPSQLFEALLEGLFLFIVTLIYWRRPRKPGLVGAVWLCWYAVVRIIGEEFRMPDAQIGFQLFGLTRGQWLSIGMLGASLCLYFYAKTRPTAEIGGWQR